MTRTATINGVVIDLDHPPTIIGPDPQAGQNAAKTVGIDRHLGMGVDQAVRHTPRGPVLFVGEPPADPDPDLSDEEFGEWSAARAKWDDLRDRLRRRGGEILSD